MIKVFILRPYAYNSRVETVANPYELGTHFAFQYEIETKIVKWYKARMIRINSDWTPALMDAHEFSGSHLTYEDWLKAIHAAAYPPDEKQANGSQAAQ